MTQTTGIRAFGAYIPRRRMARAAIAEAHSWAMPGLKSMGKGEKAFCGWDEDAITMAVEAGRDCLGNEALDGVKSLTFASVTAPYADLQNASIVAAALRLAPTCATADASGSVRAGLSALGQALEHPSADDQLILAADRRSAKAASPQEMTYGSGAAAFRVSQREDLIARFLGRETLSVPFVDHFRQAGARFDYHWEERWIRDEGVSKLVPRTIGALLRRLEFGIEKVAHLGVSGGPVGGDKLIAKALKLPAERLLPDFQGQVGDTGTAHALLQLAAAFERAQAGDIVIVASFAQGCEALAFEVLKSPQLQPAHGLGATLERRKPETAYLKMLSFDGQIELDWGMRAETDNKTALTQLYRIADQVLGFVGGRCGKCSAVQFPRFPACVNCGAIDSQTPFPLADEPAQVATYTADWLQYSVSPPLYMGLVQFEAGARVLMEIVDVGAEGLSVGAPLKMAFRIKERDRQRHYDRYFWKAAPA